MAFNIPIYSGSGFNIVLSETYPKLDSTKETFDTNAYTWDNISPSGYMMYIGSTKIYTIYVGETLVTQIYVGTTALKT